MALRLVPWGAVFKDLYLAMAISVDYSYIPR